MKFRPLREDEIECRISQIKKDGKGLSLLLYKNARCDMNILDETVGSFNWQRNHSEHKGNAYCSIGINANYKEADKEPNWIWKEDCGSESYTEKEKGEASDSFKRAGFNWGIGRELYTAPFIWIKAANCNLKEYNGKFTCSDRFSVKHIKVENGKITQLAIFNEKTKCDCFSFGLPKLPEKQENTALEADIKRLVKLAKEKGVTQKSIGEKYGVKTLYKLTMEQYEECFNELMGM